MSIDSGSSRAAVKIGLAIPPTVASISASRIRPAACAGNAHPSMHAAAVSIVLQPLLIPKTSRISPVRPLPGRRNPPAARPAFQRTMLMPAGTIYTMGGTLAFKPSRTAPSLLGSANPSAPPTLPLRLALFVSLGLRLVDAQIGHNSGRRFGSLGHRVFLVASTIGSGRHIRSRERHYPGLLGRRRLHDRSLAGARLADPARLRRGRGFLGLHLGHRLLPEKFRRGRLACGDLAFRLDA